MNDLGQEPATPDRSVLEVFWSQAKKALPSADLGNGYLSRWIGLDRETGDQILGLIRDGDKTGTFGLPWIYEHSGEQIPSPGDLMILVDFDGKPALMVRFGDVYGVSWGEISEEHIAIDGTPVRSLEVWKPMHLKFWNAKLASLGLAVTDDMPVTIEPFELVYADPGRE